MTATSSGVRTSSPVAPPGVAAMRDGETGKGDAVAVPAARGGADCRSDTRDNLQPVMAWGGQFSCRQRVGLPCRPTSSSPPIPSNQLQNRALNRSPRAAAKLHWRCDRDNAGPARWASPRGEAHPSSSQPAALLQFLGIGSIISAEPTRDQARSAAGIFLGGQARIAAGTDVDPMTIERSVPPPLVDNDKRLTLYPPCYETREDSRRVRMCPGHRTSGGRRSREAARSDSNRISTIQ